MSQPEETVMEWIPKPVTEEEQRNNLRKEQRKLEEERRNFELEKKDFYFRKKMEEKRLTEEKRLFQMKWKILEEELQNLAREKQETAKEKERYYQRKDRGRSYTVTGLGENADMFFSGVDSELALKKRYKELIKIYHPDNLSGDTGTLQMINRISKICRMRGKGCFLSSIT